MGDSDAASLAFQEASPYAIEVPVLRVFDGDGFLSKLPRGYLNEDPEDYTEVEVGIRFGFIDAPELEQRGGPEAKDFLTSLIGGRKVLIDILTKMDTGRSVDRHRRIVAVPYDVHPTLIFPVRMAFLQHALRKTRLFHVTRNIEIEMILNGWAWVLDRYEPEQVYFDALQFAQANRKGIWAYENNIHPWTFKRQKYKYRRDSAKRPDDFGACPISGCGGRLVRRNGRFGAFCGCSKYPDCRYSCSI